MKKAGIITLLAIFLFNTAGYFVVFMAERMQIKNEIRAQINAGIMDPELTAIITIDKADLHLVEFLDGGKEMNYMDNMYDIAKTTESETSFTYYCIKDSKEMLLLSRLDKHVKDHVSSKPLKGNGSKKLGDNVVKVYFSSDFSFQFHTSEVNISFPPVNALCLAAQKQNSTPPPPEFC